MTEPRRWVRHCSAQQGEGRDDAALLFGRIAAIAGALPAAKALAFLEQCGDLLEAAVAAGEPAPGVVLGPLLARYGTALKDTGKRERGAS